MVKANQPKLFAVIVGTVLCLLALVAARQAEAAFPGENGQIAFQSTRDASGEIYTVSSGGGEASRITFQLGGNVDAAWSPDGTRIAFSKGGEIAVMSANGMRSDGSGARLLTDTSTVKSDPTWSPDGTKIALVANTSDTPDAGSDGEIWVMNADGSGRKLLTNNTFEDTEPAWSPRGNKIAFVSTRRELGDTDRNIYVMDADPATNDAAVNITENGQYDEDIVYQGHDDHPTWSPDGRKIAYVHTFAANASGVPNIWVMSPNGAMASRKNLQRNEGTSGLMPAWSPFGDKIAYVGVAASSTQDIYVMNSNGSAQTPIDTGDDMKVDNKPDWQPIPVCTKTVNAGNDPLQGTAGNDVLCGNNLNNTINGAGGNDIILAGGGSDKLTGGPGNDAINGGSGRDTALYPGSTRVTANLTTEFAKGVGLDALPGIENLSGSNAMDTLTGSASTANVLNGLGGNDVLNVRDGAGGDTAVGGTGTDTCRKDSADVQKSCP